MDNKAKNSFLYNNSLSIAFVVLAIITIMAQTLTGLSQYNDFLIEHHQDPVSILQYFKSRHFIEATFENWESEFLQMG